MPRRRGTQAAGKRLAIPLLALLLLTACASGQAPDPTLTVTPVGLATEAADIIEEHALYVDDGWPATRAALISAAEDASRLVDVHAAISDAASAAGGDHTSFIPASMVQSRVDSAPADPPTVVASPGGVVTITLPGMGQEGDEERRYAETGVDGLVGLTTAETCGFVVDLRGNIGGNMFPMLGAVSPLFDAAQVARFVRGDGSASRVSVTTSSVITEDEGGEFRFAAASKVDDRLFAGKPVAVLQDASTVSAAEMVVTAFHGQGNVSTFGTETGGFSSGNDAFTLADGSLLILTTSNYADRTGAVMPLAIAPEVPTTTGDADEAALAWLAAECAEAARGG